MAETGKQTLCDRRGDDRRKAQQPFSGPDRRAGDRRSGADRRTQQRRATD